MPDGVPIHPEAELKCINQIPHTNHGVCIVVCAQAASAFEHVCLVMEWLIQARDHRGLSYIAQGD